MKEKGFTLIELLAVIVILAIIALIATPIILNIIDNTKEQSAKRSIDMYANAVENAVAQYQLNEGKSISGTFKEIESDEPEEYIQLQLQLTPGMPNFNDAPIIKVRYEGAKVVCDTINVSNDGKIYLEDCMVNGTPVEEYVYGTPPVGDGSDGGSNPTSKVCTIADADNDKIADVGEVIRCNLTEGAENFYVIEETSLTQTNGTVKMLTKKNITLDATNPIQSDSAGFVAFASSPYWVDDSGNYLPEYSSGYAYDKNSTHYTYVEAYVSRLKSNQITTAQGTLMNIEQAKKLGCSTTENTCTSAPSWVYSTSYALGNVLAGGLNGYPGVEVIDSYDGAFNSDCWDGGCSRSTPGVRPVITISISELG